MWLRPCFDAVCSHIDEFRNTDPVQAEIIFMLCRNADDALSWAAVVSAPFASTHGIRRRSCNAYLVKDVFFSSPARCASRELMPDFCAKETSGPVSAWSTANLVSQR